MATDPTQIFQANQADPLAQIQTLGAPAPLPPVAAAGQMKQHGGGLDGGIDRPRFGSYIPQGLVQMLMRMQAQNPDRFNAMLGRPFAQRFGLSPETDLANLYTRQMARQDFRGGTAPMAAGTVLSPDQRSAYPAMRPMPDFTGGVGNQAPAQPGGGQGFAAPIGLAERKAPGSLPGSSNVTY